MEDESENRMISHRPDGGERRMNMRKITAMMLSLLILLFSIPGPAEETVLRREIQYPGQNITLAVPAQCLTFYRDDMGLGVNYNDADENGYCRIRILDPDPAFDDQAYLEKTVIPDLESAYVFGKSDYLDKVGKVKVFIVAGREMTGLQYTTTLVSPKTGWVLLDRWNGLPVRYDAVFETASPDKTLLLLSGIIRGANGDALAPKADSRKLSTVTCAEQSFSFRADPAYTTKYTEKEGVTVYTGKEGKIPYIMVYQGRDRIMEPYEYLKEQYTPHIKDQYGDNLKYASEYKDFIIGGKALPAGKYEYMVQGKRVIMLRLMDSTGPHTVVYTAKFLQGEGAQTMMALEEAIRSFTSD